MTNFIKSKLNISLVFIAILVVVCAILTSCVLSLNSNSYGLSNVDSENLAVSAGNITAGLKSAGDGLEDGSVPEGYSHTANNNLTWNLYDPGIIANKGWLDTSNNNDTGTKNYYINKDLYLNFTQRAWGTYSGTFDGCGHTIYVSAYEDYDSDRSDKNEGFFTGTLSGTIKNCKIVFTRLGYHLTKNNRAITKTDNYLGGIAGTLASSGKLENVKIEFTNSENKYYFEAQMWKADMYYGMLFGKIDNGTIQKVTIDVQGNMSYRKYNKAGSGNYSYLFLGLLSGMCQTASSKIKNITIKGWGNFVNSESSGGGSTSAGVLFGKIKGVAVSINGLLIGDYTGSIGAQNIGKYVGETQDNPSLSISNLFSKTGAWEEETTNHSGTNSSFNATITNKRYYSLDSNKIGFSYTNYDYLWVGQFSNCSYDITVTPDESNRTLGNYVNSITIGNSSVDTNSIAPYGIDDQVIPMLNKSDIDGDITTYAYTGKYIYTDDCYINSVNSVTYSSNHTQSDYSRTTIYNGKELNVKDINNAYISSSSCSPTNSSLSFIINENNHTDFKDDNGNKAKDVKYSGNNITYYSLYANCKIGYNTTSSRCVVYAKCEIRITITKANPLAFTDNYQNKEYVYNSNKRGIELDIANDFTFTADPSNSNLKIDATNIANELSHSSIKYSASLNGTYGAETDALKVQNVSDGEKTVYYEIELKNFNSFRGYRKIKIIQANIEINTNYTVSSTPQANFVYCGYDFVFNNSINNIALVENYFNELMKFAQTSPSDPSSKLDYVNSIKSGIFSFTTSVANETNKNIKDVGSYWFEIDIIGSMNGNYTLAPGPYRFNFAIVKATPTITFNEIDSNPISFTPISSTNYEGSSSDSSYYDFDSRTIPVAQATIESGFELTSEIGFTRSVKKGSNTYSDNTIKNVGVYTITYNFAGDGNINPVKYVYTYNIIKNTLQINLKPNITRAYYHATSISPSNFKNEFINSVTLVHGTSLHSTSENLLVTQSAYVNLNYTMKYNDVDCTSNQPNILNAGEYKITFSITNTDNYSANSATYTYTINKVPLRIVFNDTKDLYDSILDYLAINSTSGYYDFIYVQASSNNENSYINQHLSSFVDEYRQYFNNVVLTNGSLVNINKVVLQSQNINTTSVSNNYLSWAWSDNAEDNLRINYDINNVVYNTTGKGYSDGFTSYCEDAQSSNYDGNTNYYKVRIIVVAKPNMNNIANNQAGTASSDRGLKLNRSHCNIIDNSSGNALIYFIEGHYYDTDNDSTIQGYKRALTCTILEQLYYHRAFNGSRIMASYKTLDGNNQTFLMKMYKGVDNSSTAFDADGIISQISGKTTAFNNTAQDGDYGSLNISSVETNFVNSNNTDNAFKQEYPAYTNLDNVDYYGAAALVALNYGTIKNFKVDYNMETGGSTWKNGRLIICSHLAKNTAIGTLAGINMGIVSGNSIDSTRLLIYKGLNDSINVAGGQLVGINNGYLGNNSFSYSTQIHEVDGGATNDYYTYFTMKGNMSNGYFGLACGINLSRGILSTMEHTNTASLSADVTGNIYGGGFVGKNTGIVKDLTYNNNQADYMRTRDSWWYEAGFIGIGSKSGDGDVSYDYRGNELSFKGSNVYAGGIVGYSEGGEINNCKFVNSTSAETGAAFKAIPAADKAVYMGGIVGYLKNGTINAEHENENNNCTVLNYGQIIAGSSVALRAYALGGIAGVSSGGNINKCSVSNYGTLSGIASAYSEYGLYVGGLLGVGCEDGTSTSAPTYSAKNRVKFNNENIEPGSLTLSSVFNYGIIGASNGFWGYLTGRYNTILSNSGYLNDGYDYTHEYGGLFWYTNNTPDGYDKCIFGGIASILGHIEYLNGVTDGNGNPVEVNSHNVYITGVAGIDLSDSGNNTVASALFDGAEMKEGIANIKFKTVSSTYRGMDVYSINSNDTIEFADIYASDGTTKLSGNNPHISGNNYYYNISSRGAQSGVIKISQEKLNAIITDTTVTASMAKIIMRFYIDLTGNSEYTNFISGNGNKNNNLYYAAGYGLIANSYNVDGAPWSETMNKLKTLDGQGYAINYTNPSNNAAQWSTNPNYTTSTDSNSQWKAVGNIIGVNYGEIKNLNVVLSSTNSAYEVTSSGAGTDNKVYSAYAPIAGANEGYIHNCSVTIKDNNIVGLQGKSKANELDRLALGGIAGISLGKIENCQVKFQDNATLGIKSKDGVYNANQIAYIGGAVGLQSGGSLKDIVIIGKGNIKVQPSYEEVDNKKDVKDIGSFVGGIAGYAMYAINDVAPNECSIALRDVEMQNFIVALVGEISTMSTARGGSGYLFGRCLYQDSGLATTISGINMGVLLAFVGGEPKATSRDGFSVSNTILGNPKQSPNDENLSWSIIPNLYIVSISDYSYKGLAAMSFVTYISVRLDAHSINPSNTVVEYKNIDNPSNQISVLTQKISGSSVVKINSVTLTTPSLTDVSAINGTPSVARGEYNIGTGKFNLGSATNFTSNSYTNSQEISSQKGIKLVLNYKVNISGETLDWKSAASTFDSPFMNFVRGRGSRAIYAGAKEGTLQDDITYDKKMNAATVLVEGKILDGGNHKLKSVWDGPDTGNEIMGLTDNTHDWQAYARGNVSSYDYPYYMTLDNERYYGVSDLVSINYGTIKNLTVEYPSNKARHKFIAINANTAYGMIAGINYGTIENCTAKIANSTGASFMSNNADYNVCVGAITGINLGTIQKSKVELDTKFEMIGNDDIEGNSAKYYIMGGFVGYHAQSGIIKDCEIQIDGTLARSAKAKYIILGGFAGIASGEINAIAIRGEGVLNAGTQSVEKIYVAAAIAIANNLDEGVDVGTGRTNPPNIGDEENQLLIHSCTNNGVNKIKNIIVEFSGTFIFEATSADSSKFGYMAGVFFAKATQYLSSTNDHPAYTGLIYSSAYNSDIEMYYLSSEYGSSISYNGSILNVPGISLMGWVEGHGETNVSDFFKGGQIITNASPEVTLSWEIAQGTNPNPTGNILAKTIDKTSINIDKAQIIYVSDKDIVEDVNNSQYITYNNTNSSSELTILIKALTLNELYNNESKVMAINIELYYPAVVINDIYQLVQFIWFNSSDSNNNKILDYYLRTYAEEIVKATSKQATNDNKYGSWALKNQSDLSTFIDLYPENERIDYGNYYLFLEKYKNPELANPILYYKATRGILGANIDLGKFNNNSVDFGFDCAQWAEFDKNKILDGDGKTITIIATGVSGFTSGNSNYKYEPDLPNTSKWYRASNNSRQLNERALSDIQDTPANGDSTAYLFGGFLGIIRGTIKNVNFEFKDGTLFNIAGYLPKEGWTNYEAQYSTTALAPVWIDHSIFAGIIAAYTTGTIDSCTLTMGDYSQIYVNKFAYVDNDAPYYHHVSIGGVTGLLGKHGTISNTTLTMGYGANIGAQNIGSWHRSAAYYRKGTLRTYAGGFAGMMLGNSQIFNAKIKGDETSKIFAFTSNNKYDGTSRFDTAIGAAGGIVGCNSTNYAFSFYSQAWKDFYSGSNKNNEANAMNSTPLGAGVIDGVIYDWEGTSISNFYDSQGGRTDKDELDVYCLKGNIIGAIGDRDGSNLKFKNAGNYAKNLYYTYSLDKFTPEFLSRGAVYAYQTKVNEANNGITGETVQAVNLSGVDTIVNYTEGLRFETAAPNKAHPHSAAAISLSEQLSGTQVLKANTLRVFKLTDEEEVGDGINVTWTDSDKVQNTNLYIKNIPNIQTNFEASGYEELDDLGDILSWADKTKGSNIVCAFSVESDDLSSVMWSITIKGARVLSNKLNYEETAVTKIPIYMFATDITNAQSYKNINYTINRGAKSMELYYCTGDAATLAPDKNYYVNLNPDEMTTYYPLRAIMYDGVKDATGESLNIYDYNGEDISRLTYNIGDEINKKLEIISTAKSDSCLNSSISILKNGNYLDYDVEQDDIKAVGSYKIEYNIKTNNINANAYVSEDYRVQFFSSDGSSADGNGVIETYTIYIVIAPINLGIISVSKVYDGTTNLQKTTGTDKNYSLIQCEINDTYDYLNEYMPTNVSVSCSSTGEIILGSTSGVKITPKGKYNNKNVGARVVTFDHVSTPITYTLYEYDELNNRYIERVITKYYLADNSGTTRTYFSIAGSSVYNATGSNTLRKLYKFDGNTSTYGFDMWANATTDNHKATVNIVEARALNIVANIPNYEYEYTGKVINFGIELSSYITLTDQFNQNVSAATLIDNNELTITQSEGSQVEIKNVVQGGYTITFKISYVGDNYAKKSIETTGTIFVKPAQLTVTKVIKNYDGNTTTTNATILVTGLKEHDTVTGLSGNYNTPNIGTGIKVTINTTSLPINGHTYNIVLTNYYVENADFNVGIIVPVAATIENAYKNYDSENTVIYTGSEVSHILIKDSGGNKLNYQINATYKDTKVGQTSLIVTLRKFDYVDENNQAQSKYILTNAGANTNYCIDGATSVNVEISNIAYILPIQATVSSVTKEYDGTTALGTFVISGTLSVDNITAFDGVYSSANVNYDGNSTYNDVLLDTEAYTYYYHNNGGEILTHTVKLLLSNSISTNYVLKDNTYTISSDKYIIEGVGVIIPKLVELTAVKKYYDGKYTFDSINIDRLELVTYIHFDVDGTIVDDYHISGRMNGRDATNGNNLYTVTVDSTPFTDMQGNSYVWLVHNSNAYNNYRIESESVSGIGDVLQLNISVTSSTGSNKDGVFYDLSFKRTGLSEVRINAGSEYRYGQTYGIANLKAKFNWNGTTYTLENGKLTIEGVTLEFTLDKTVTNVGTHTFSLSLTSTNANFNMQTSNTFRFEIKKRTLLASEIYVSITSNATKEYDGTNSTTEIIVGTLGGIKAVAAGVSASETITTWTSSSASASGINGSIVSISGIDDAINAGIYNVTSSVIVTLESTNYKCVGVTTYNVYVDGYTTPLAYEITKKQLEIQGDIEKEFDGTSGSIVVDGVEGEKVILTYTGLGIMPGEYSGSPEFIVSAVDSSMSETNTDASIVGNYSVVSGAVNLTIKPAKIITQRQYYTTEEGINYFKLAIAFTELKGFDFLKEANSLCNITQASDIESISNKDKLDDAIAALLAINYNDSVSYTSINTSKIEKYNVYTSTRNGEDIYTIEIIYSGHDQLDNETLTDRYSVYMVDNTFDITSIGSNIAISSSELEAGQFSGTKNTTGTQIDSLAKLVEFMNAGTGTAYLTKNIYGYDASKITTTTFNGTLYGNGYSIVLTGDYNTNETYAGLFVAVNTGNIYDVNFMYLSNSIVLTEKTGLVIGSNTGVISNVSLEIYNPIIIDEEIEDSVTIGGLVNTSTGTLSNITIVYGCDVEITAFGGLAHTITSGTVNYIAIRDNDLYTISGKAIAVSGITIAYAIDAMNSVHTNFGTGSVTKLYDKSTTELSMFSDTYTNGHLDYYFTNLNKYTTATSLHNVYDDSSTNNENTSYYYDYNSSKTGIRIAIEVIAPLNRFIWEAFDANYIVYQTYLNRAVGLFDLDKVLEDNPLTANCETLGTSITFITNYVNSQSNTQYVTIFNPAIGIIASAVVSSGTGAVQVKEYTGALVEATFTVTSDGGETYNLSISGVDVGVYTEYYEEAQGEGTAVVNGFDPNTRVAKVLSSESGDVQATIMLVITPKTISNDVNLTKEYDKTTIAETVLDTNNNGTNNVYAVGSFNNYVVGNGYKVDYNSYTRPVATYNNNFVTVYLSGITDGKRVYTVQYVYANSQALTTTTNISTLPLEDLAIAYSKIATIDEIQALENDSQHNIVNFAISGVTSSQDLSEVYIKDLAFGHTVSNTGFVTYTTGIYYATTLYNISDKVENKNYKYVWSTGNVYTGTTLVDQNNLTTKTYVAHTASTTGGSITQRTLQATYDNLNQSYRKKLENITIKIANITEIENLPYSYPEDQKSVLIAALQLELQNQTFTADVLGATIDAGSTDIELRDDGYYATSQTYKEVALVSITGNYSVTQNLAVNISGGATLILRYFEYDKTTEKFIIDTIDALLMIDSNEEENDYQTLDYKITNNINGKSKLVTTFTNTFYGTIEGYGYAIKNIVLVGSTNTGLFNEIAEDAYVNNVKFMNVLVVATSSNSNVSVVSVTNNGLIKDVVIEGYIASDKAINLGLINVLGDGTTQNNKAFVQTSISATNLTIQTNASDLTSELVVMLRAYGNKGLSITNNIVNIYINGNNNKTYSNISDSVKAIISEGIQGIPVTINNQGKVVIDNFRQYWAYSNLCLWLDATRTTNFLGYQFEI